MSRRRLLLAGGWLVQAGLRAWLSHRQAVPLANTLVVELAKRAKRLARGRVQPDGRLGGVERQVAL